MQSLVFSLLPHSGLRWSPQASSPLLFDKPSFHHLHQRSLRSRAIVFLFLRELLTLEVISNLDQILAAAVILKPIISLLVAMPVSPNEEGMILILIFLLHTHNYYMSSL